MFNMFSSYSRYASYGRGMDSSDDEESVSSGFRLNQSSAAAGQGNVALEAALTMDAEAGKIALETDAGDDAMDVDAAVADRLKHLCVECRDQPAILTCDQCADNYCDVCFQAMHKRGTRATHTNKPYSAGITLDKSVSSSSAAAAAASATSSSESKDEVMEESTNAKQKTEDEILEDEFEETYQRSKNNNIGASSAAAASTSAGDDEEDDDGASSVGSSKAIVLPSREMNSSLLSGNISAKVPEGWFTDRARYIPLRLTLEERKFLRLLEATLNVSEYTDKIDIVSNKDKMTRIKEQLRDLCSILSGLVVANDYKLGQKLLKDKEFADNEEFFRNIMELGRRHKVRNPEKMRSTYAKLVYIIQDSVTPQIEELMGFNLYAPLKTVYAKLVECGAEACLQDEHMMLATGDIKTEGRGRPEIERDIKRKEAAVTYLARRYMNSKIDEENMRACILSVADNHTFLIQNRHCCDTMLQWLQEGYDPVEPRAPFSLAILGGRNGARLTHSHAAQYSYVLQSLTLWREILHDMFRLWCLTEEDLFDANNPYRLRNTGQGLNRVQSCPRVGKAMHNLLSHCQRKLGSWVGSSVVHLGDHNVPNSLMFIDKYNQVSRILNPLVLTIKAIPRLCEKKDIKLYIDTIFGGAEKLKMIILTDFFRSGFDGSGADNFFDAGSRIDGRLTSAWNFCNKIEKKSYYPIFQLAGFASFDGQWSD